MQTRLGSLIEAWAGVVVGFAINYAMNLTVLPWWFDVHVQPSSAFGLGLLYTVVSMARSYGLRRVFNAGLVQRYTAVCPAPPPAAPSPPAQKTQ